ncbi:hypothetical protein I6F35_34230 [Bradyrhizobium sp. BRP22]|uniref:hypothetical protein n=1 Tax=Bradyrhizobium sp. BRP22 TaxID=2793821 RepID=UPI001CD1E5FA|nr:hypothetical protein [Bradyrhizobium sp. BRP22]MCA1458187.1 hypothetical protein [Bradyrhizobium sp. BRP22]
MKNHPSIQDNGRTPGGRCDANCLPPRAERFTGGIQKNTQSRSARSSAMSGTRHALQSQQADLKKVERYQILERWHATCQFAGNRCGQMNGEL